MKKFAFGFALAALTATAAVSAGAAEEINMVLSFSGGFQHKLAVMIEKPFADKGITMNTTTIKSCADRFKFITNNPKNTILHMDIGDVLYSAPDVGVNCPPLTSLPGELEVITSLYESPLVLMNNPSNKLTSYAK